MTNHLYENILYVKGTHTAQAHQTKGSTKRDKKGTPYGTLKNQQKKQQRTRLKGTVNGTPQGTTKGIPKGTTCFVRVRRSVGPLVVRVSSSSLV